MDHNWAVTESWKPMITMEASSSGAITALRVAWRYLYTAASDGTVKVWDIQYLYDDDEKKEVKLGIKSLNLLASVPVHSGPISALTFVGGVLYSSSHDMSIVPYLEPYKESDEKDHSKVSSFFVEKK